MPVPKLLNAKCDLKVTAAPNDLNLRHVLPYSTCLTICIETCHAARFQSLSAFKLSIVVLSSSCYTLDSWQIKNYFDAREFDCDSSVEVVDASRLAMRRILWPKTNFFLPWGGFCDLNQKASRIKDLFFGSQGEIYFWLCYNVYYMPVFFCSCRHPKFSLATFF